jgi:hypothetical protein
MVVDKSGLSRVHSYLLHKDKIYIRKVEFHWQNVQILKAVLNQW